QIKDALEPIGRGPKAASRTAVRGRSYTRPNGWNEWNARSRSAPSPRAPWRARTMEDAVPRPGGAALRRLALLDHVLHQATGAVGTAREVPNRYARLGPLWPGTLGQADRKSP